MRGTLSLTENGTVDEPAGAEAERPSDRVIEQRVRNSLIEYFELASSFGAQQEYERDAPIAYVPYEVIEQWADWVPHLDLYLADSGAYSSAETEEIRRFQVVWEATTKAVPDDYPTLAHVQAMPAWEELRQAAESALAVFARRGRLPEDHESS